MIVKLPSGHYLNLDHVVMAEEGTVLLTGCNYHERWDADAADWAALSRWLDIVATDLSEGDDNEH